MLSLQTSRDKYNVANYRLLHGCLIWHLNINTHTLTTLPRQLKHAFLQSPHRAAGLASSPPTQVAPRPRIKKRKEAPSSVFTSTSPLNQATN